MAMSNIELKAQRAQTAAFIDANPSSIALIPKREVRSGTGSTWEALPPRAAQIFRIIDNSAATGPTPGTMIAADGAQRVVKCALIGQHDAEVGLWDSWVDSDGVKWEVAELMPRNGYSRRAMVVSYG